MFKRLDAAEVRALGAVLQLDLSQDEAEVMAAQLGHDVAAFEQLDALRMDDDRPLAAPRMVYDAGRRPTEAEDPLRAFITLCDVRGSDGGSLQGTRVGLKDNIAVAGVPMTFGVQLMDGYVPDFDATVTIRLLAAGARIVGKTNMDGFSFGGYGWGGVGDYGRTVNPHGAEFLTGGSSQGSAVAVASGAVELAFGGDQGGSIRLPAAWCGVVGLKATHGLIPHSGVFALDPVVDFTGPIARTVATVATALQAVAGRDQLDPRQRDVPVELPDYVEAASQEVAGLRVGVLAEGFAGGCDEEVAAAVRAAVDELAEQGAVVEDVSVPLHELGTLPIAPLWSEGLRLLWDTNLAGAFAASYYPTSLVSAIGRAKTTNGHELPLNVKRSLVVGEYLRRYHQGRLYARAQNLRRRFAAAYDEAFERVDVLVMPTSSLPVQRFHPPATHRDAIEQTLFGGAAPDLGTIIRNTVPFNYTGHPAISVPCGLAGGMPVGMQIVGPRFGDDVVLRAAAGYERGRRVEIAPSPPS